MKPGKPRSALFLPVILLVTGCVPMSEARRHDLEYARADFRAQFVEDRARCQTEGRQFFVTGWGGSFDREGIPRTRVRYECR